MRRNTYRELIEDMHQEKIPKILLEHVKEGLSDLQGAEAMKVPISTYKRWKGEHLQKTYQLKETAANR